MNSHKGIDNSRDGSYGRRCDLAALAKDKGPEYALEVMRSVQPNRTPSKSVKRLVARRKSHLDKRRLRAAEAKADPNATPAPSRFKKRRQRGAGPDGHYGDVTQDMDENERKAAEQKIIDDLTDLCDTEEKRRALEKATRGQFANPYYKEIRSWCVGSSKFGTIDKRHDYTPCHNLVKYLTKYDDDDDDAGKAEKKQRKKGNGGWVDPREFGKAMEPLAVKYWESKEDRSTEESGLFLDPKHPFLLATPDRLVGDTELLEIKSLCTQSQKYKKINLNEVKCLRKLRNGEFVVKREHDFHYQIQGQLNIADKALCHLALYLRHEEPGQKPIEDMKVFAVPRDKKFYEDTKPRLIQFYKTAILPELADSRIKRKMKCREPQYILDAIEERKQKNSNKPPPKKKQKKS